MALDRTLVQIRERSYLDILDLALVVVRRRPTAIGATALLGIAPWALLNAWLTSGLDEPWAPVNVLLIALEAPLATAPLTIVLGGLMFGRRPRAGAVASTMLRASGPLLLYDGLIRPLLLATILFSWVVPARFAFLNEVILLERGPWWKVARRCSDLSSDRGGELFGQWIVQFFFGGMFVFAFWFASGQVLDVVRGGELPWSRPEWEAVFNVRTLVALWIAVAFFGLARFLSYIDQRIRLEGWEIELRLRAAGRIISEGLEP